MPGGPKHGDETAVSFRQGAVEGAVQYRELVATSDERCIEPPFEAARLDHPHEPIREHEIRLPLERERLDASTSIAPRARRRVVSPIRISPGCAACSKTRCDVDGVAVASRSSVAGDDLARIDAGAKRQRTP